MNETFKAGEYIVLLKSCDGKNSWSWSGLPTDHVYKLKDDYTKYSFFPEIDTRGSRSNGWSGPESGSYNSQMEARAATEDEIMLYKLEGKPTHIDRTEGNYKWSSLKEEDQRLFLKKVIGTLIVDDEAYMEIKRIIKA